jgi:SAM-dependent methyltransferase
MADEPRELDEIREFYDRDYYASIDAAPRRTTWHERVVAGRLGELRGKRVLDVACGLGQWLDLLHERGARVSGIDISERAIAHCRAQFPDGDFRAGPAETLPFADASFDLVTCMGSLEHFVDKPGALREMARVAAPGAKLLILVPNAGFLTRRLGLYRGTWQTKAREDVLTLPAWAALLEGAGLRIDARWRDLHTLDAHWIASGPAWRWPLRAAQALALPLWPLAWQYQVHHLCRRAGDAAASA